MEIKQYKEIEVEVETVQYNEKDLENQIQYILTQNPDKVSKEGLIENGDTAIIDTIKEANISKINNFLCGL